MGSAGANSKAIQMLYDAIANDRDPEVRQAAATSLGEMRARVGDPQTEIDHGERCSRQLCGMGAEQAADALLGPFSIGLRLATELRKDAGAQGRLLAITLLTQQCSPETGGSSEFRQIFCSGCSGCISDSNQRKGKERGLIAEIGRVGCYRHR
jgi:hypothetical protein